MFASSLLLFARFRAAALIVLFQKLSSAWNLVPKDGWMDGCVSQEASILDQLHKSLRSKPNPDIPLFLGATSQLFHHS